MAWRRTHIGPEQDHGQVGGLPVWKHEWCRQAGEVWLPEDAPSGSQQNFQIYEIGGVGWPVKCGSGHGNLQWRVAFWEEV